MNGSVRRRDIVAGGMATAALPRAGQCPLILFNSGGVRFGDGQ